ncbi:MAG: ATP-binding cassette domain-containing protein [Deltaproteobacteria bacterium]|jgi:peptide/nickel transport system ATP-binding protein|nr:ATP-binding cassette domain-containing protein [Deltaproteobacteria bacterium]
MGGLKVEMLRVNETILEIRGVSREFTSRGGMFGPGLRVRAVHSVNLSLPRQSILGLVGESGSGKSTLARISVRLLRPGAGNVFLQGQALFPDRGKKTSRIFLRNLPSRLQMIFQDPYSSLNPRLKIGYSIAEPLLCLGIPSKERRERVLALLEEVGLNPADAARYPHEFSGGQRQRIALARALAPRPEVLICDEPVSALDASVQAQVLNLLKDRQEALRLSCLFISHDLTVVGHMSERTAVMYLGRIVELGPTDELFSRPLHPYTRMLLEASGQEKSGRKHPLRLPGAGSPPPERGCVFAPRCPLVLPDCRLLEPAEKEEGERRVSCLRL